MLDDMERMIKEKLLNELIGRMSDMGGDRMKPKGLGVEVQAPDKEHLQQGLEKAQDLVSKAPAAEASEGSDDDDEKRLMALLGDDEDDDDKEF